MKKSNMIDLLNAGSTRDEAIIELTKEGITLNAATKLYAVCAKELGLINPVGQNKADALVWLEDYRGNWTAETVTDCVIELQDKFSVAESTARDYVKAFSDSLGVVHPVIDPRDVMFNWMKSNIELSEDEFRDAFHEFGATLGRSKSNVNEYVKAAKFYRFMSA